VGAERNVDVRGSGRVDVLIHEFILEEGLHTDHTTCLSVRSST
jgi:hypothetical protein